MKKKKKEKKNTVLKRKVIKRKITMNILILATVTRMRKVLPSTEVFSLFGATSTRVTNKMPNQVSARRRRYKKLQLTSYGPFFVFFFNLIKSNFYGLVKL